MCANKPEVWCNHAILCRADCLAFACKVCRCYYNYGLFDYAILWRGQKAPWDVDLDAYAVRRACTDTGLQESRPARESAAHTGAVFDNSN